MNGTNFRIGSGPFPPLWEIRLFLLFWTNSYKGIETLALTNYTKKETKEYIDKVKKESIYKFNVDTRDDDNLISLITCTRFFGPDKEAAFVVDARMLRQKEKARNYTVKTTDNYKKIEKYMEKGDETNG